MFKKIQDSSSVSPSIRHLYPGITYQIAFVSIYTIVLRAPFRIKNINPSNNGSHKPRRCKKSKLT